MALVRWSARKCPGEQPLRRILVEEVLQLFCQPLNINRLCQIPIEARLQSLFSVALHSIGRKGKYLHVGKTWRVPKLVENGVSVQHRHLNIEQDEVGLSLLDSVEGLLTILGFNHLVAASLQNFAYQFPIWQVVFGHKDLAHDCPTVLASGGLLTALTSCAKRSFFQDTSFRNKARAPRFRILLSRSVRSFAVRTKTGTSHNSGISFIAQRTSKPSISGIIRSSRIASTSTFDKNSRASLPLDTVCGV